MIDELINLLTELAVNPDTQISEKTLNDYQITHEGLRSALLNRDKQALMRFLDAKNRTLLESNNSTIYSIAGQVEVAPPAQVEESDGTFRLKYQENPQLILVNTNAPTERYVVRVQSGELKTSLAALDSLLEGAEGFDYLIGGRVETPQPVPVKGEVTFQLEDQNTYELVLINTNSNDIYVACVQSGELKGSSVSDSEEGEGSEGETP